MSALPLRVAVAAPVERTPPHSVEAEQSVLGGLLLDNSAWERASYLTESDFYSHEHRCIFGAIGALVNAGQPADQITVFEQLQSLGQAEECGGLKYISALAQSVPSAANMRGYAKIVREHSDMRRLIAASQGVIDRAYDPKGAVAAGIVADAAPELAQFVAPTAAFAEVDLSDLGQTEPAPQAWLWEGYLPAGHVTLLGGHGGAGKSTLALMLAACVAVGRDCLGRATAPANVLFFSGEDPAPLVLARLARVCSMLDLDPAQVGQRLRVIDATDADPVLFSERRFDGIRAGVTTPTYAELARYVEANETDLLIADNASDVFDGDEINRPMVRAFMRAMARLVKQRDGAVLLLAHVDKATSRAGKSASSESYSGSTAWHNSARSRLFLVEKEPGLLELQHQKCNVGPKLPPLALEWPSDGLPQAAVSVGAGVQWITDKNDTRALLRLVAEYAKRGEYVATATNSPANAARLFEGERTLPKRGKSGELFGLLRDAERSGLIERQEYRSTDRKPRERWGLTAAGFDLIGAAPSAPCAPSDEHGAGSADGAGALRQVRHVHGGGYGGAARAHFVGADVPEGRP